MRVAVFTDSDFSKVNGITNVLRAVRRYAPDGIEPRIYTASDIEQHADGYFSPASWGCDLPWSRQMRVYWPPLARFARAMRADHIDVVHLTTPGPVGFAGRWLADRTGAPIVGSYDTHAADYGPHTGRFTGLVEYYTRWIYGRCDPLLVPSQAARDLLSSRRFPIDRIGLWRRGVDTSRFRPERRSDARRAAWHVDDRRPAILYVGRLAKDKGLGVVPEISAALWRARVAHQLVFAGDGPMRAELQSACPDAVFLGTLPQDDVGALMASADVFLFPGTAEALGTVVLEAQSSGLPVVVSDRGGPSEQILRNTTGIVCKAGNAQEFVAALTTLLRSSETRRAIGRAGRQHALGRSWPAALGPLYDAWRRAVGGQAAGHGTGQGRACHTSAAYSAMVRSLEKRSDDATFRIALRGHSRRFDMSTAK